MHLPQLGAHLAQLELPQPSTAKLLSQQALPSETKLPQHQAAADRAHTAAELPAPILPRMHLPDQAHQAPWEISLAP